MTARRTDMLIPKPTRLRRKPFLPALGDVGLALMLGGLAPPERRAMAAIAESADVLTVKNQSWLLVPAPAWLLHTLAVFGAECEDREPSLEDEPETDAGIEDGWEDDRNDEEDFRRAPRRLSGPSVRVAKEYEERMGWSPFASSPPKTRRECMRSQATDRRPHRQLAPPQVVVGLFFVRLLPQPR